MKVNASTVLWVTSLWALLPSFASSSSMMDGAGGKMSRSGKGMHKQMMHMSPMSTKGMTTMTSMSTKGKGMTPMSTKGKGAMPSKGKGKGMSVRSKKASAVTAVSVDFSDATSNPVTLLSVSPVGTQVDVELTLPGEGTDGEVYTVVGSDPALGSSCPPANGELVPTTAITLTISIAGVDTVIVFCQGGVVVAKCIHLFPEQEEINTGGGPIPGSLPESIGTADFSGASAANLITLRVPFTASGYFLFSGTADVDFFYSPSGTFNVGDPCPPADAVFLDPIEGLNFALFLVQGSEGFTIYACDGTIVGICIFEYVPPLPGGTAFPTNAPSSSPTFSCDACDDGDLCTTDSCDRQTGECIFTPLPCGTDEACDSFTGICQNIQTIVPCVAVIDEWDNRNYSAEWASLRSLYPRRPFCLLVPNVGVQFLPAGFDADTVNNPDGIDRTIALTVNRDGGNGALASDWYSACELDRISPSSVPFVGLFIDTSGSMTLNTVRASYNDFLGDVAAANLTIAQVFNGQERWITPFLTTLAP